MDIFLLAAIAITGSLIMVCMGLSFLSQSLNALDYSDTPYELNELKQNPLIRFKSKYFHYRPKNSVLLTKDKWAKVEKSIAGQIATAEKTGEFKGYEQAIKDVKEKVDEEKSNFPTNPYKILEVNADMDEPTVKRALKLKLDLYALDKFTEFDKAFQELAEIRREQFRKAYDEITSGLKNGS